MSVVGRVRLLAVLEPLNEAGPRVIHGAKKAASEQLILFRRERDGGWSTPVLVDVFDTAAAGAWVEERRVRSPVPAAHAADGLA